MSEVVVTTNPDGVAQILAAVSSAAASL